MTRLSSGRPLMTLDRPSREHHHVQQRRVRCWKSRATSETTRARLPITPSGILAAAATSRFGSRHVRFGRRAIILASLDNGDLVVPVRDARAGLGGERLEVAAPVDDHDAVAVE